MIVTMFSQVLHFRPTSRRTRGNWKIRTRRLVGLAVFLSLGAFGDWSNAQEQPKRKISSTTEIKRVLQQSADGQPIDRSAALEAARKNEPDNHEVQWQSGHTLWKDRWVRFDELSGDSELRAKIAEYERRREGAADTVVEQLRLADWCRDNGLPIQERSHLLAMLKHEPNNIVARTRAGWRAIAGRWVSEDEIQAMKQQMEATAKAAREAAPTLKRAFTALDSPRYDERLRAEKSLGQLLDPDLVPVYIRAFSTASETSQIKLLRAIEGSGGQIASIFLVQIALQDPASNVGFEATKALRNRPLYDFVPMLLSLMATPVETRFRIQQVGYGDARLIQVFANEIEDFKQFDWRMSAIGGQSVIERQQALQKLFEQGMNRKEEMNRAIQQMNSKATMVLNQVTKQDLPPNPDVWWKWWNDLNESYPVGKKKVISTASYSAAMITKSLSLHPRHECLVAGTPIWTITGAKAVEEIKSGDLVLTQHPDSGELAYKAVIMPTKRPAGPTVKIELTNETIRASSGHLFWVAGNGWTRAGTLAPGQLIHDVTGSSAIKAVREDDEPVETFNLIVDNFHSYFVGQSKILSHDNTTPRGTDAKIPGLRGK